VVRAARRTAGASGRRFNIIYADPPWHYQSWARRSSAAGEGGRTGRGVPYPTMPTSAICALPVAELAAQDALLFLWATYPMLPDALRVIGSWGFAYKGVAFTWCKLNPSGVGWHFGLGYWTRGNPEICLLATKGRPRRQSRKVANLVVSPRREHSRKPHEVRERIVALCGDLPRVELFARQKTPGWSAWGNEVDSDIALTGRDQRAA